MLPDKHFFLLRHARSQANDLQIMSGGDCDSPLCNIGRGQAARVRDIARLLPVKPDVIFHSPQARATETASIVNEAFGAPMVRLEALREIKVGTLNGVPWPEAERHFLEKIPFPGGESFEHFYERVGEALRHIFEQPCAVPMIVAHGGTFEAFSQLFGISVDMSKVLNCHLHEFEPHGRVRVDFRWQVWEHNPGETPQRAQARAFRVAIPGHGI